MQRARRQAARGKAGARRSIDAEFMVITQFLMIESRFR